MKSLAEMRAVNRAHVIAWRKDLELRHLAGSTVRRKLTALSALFEYLCDRNAVETNPVKGVKRPKVESYEGKTPALGDHQARPLLEAPDPGDAQGQARSSAHLAPAGHAGDQDGALFLPIRNNRTRRVDVPLTAHALYEHVVRYYGKKSGLLSERFGPMRCAPRPRPMRSIMKRISRRCRSG